MSSSKRRSSSSLPLELVEEILCRVPVESLERFRTICKQWCTLFDDKRFIYKSLDLANEKRFIQVNHRSVNLFKVEPEALLCLPIPEELHHKSFTETIHCDGLLLVILNACSDQNRKLAVWNPFLSRVKLIEPSSPQTKHEIYGFGYDNVSRDNYKILRIKTPEHTYNYTQGRSSEIEIYEFKSKLWRSVDATLDDECKLFRWKHVSMNGNMYWIAQARMVNSKFETFIQSFDFSTETFKPICCVPDGTGSYYEDHYHMILSGFGGDRLSLLHQDKYMKIGVWITNKVTDGIVSWSRLFNVDSPHLSILQTNIYSFPTYYIHKTNKIMFWCENSDGKQINGNVYEIGEGEINKLVVMRSRYTSGTFKNFCHVYVPSLVPVPE